MNRVTRLILSILLPPLLATVIGCIVAAAMGDDPFRKIGWALKVAYLFGAIPSLVYAVAMDRVYGRIAKPETWKAVWISTLLGAGAGLLISLPMLRDAVLLAGYLCGNGAVVGFLLGWVIRVFAARHHQNLANHSTEPTTSAVH
jgi:NhaP-type Na+/H+ or K+/H+ antiporter